MYDKHPVITYDMLMTNKTLTTIVKNPDGTYTYTNEAGDTVTIDATDNVISNFENIVNNTNVLNELIEVLGDTYVGGNVYYRSEEHTSELQSRPHLVCRLLLEKKKKKKYYKKI